MRILSNTINYLRGGFGVHYRQSAAVLSFNQDGLEIARVRHERRFLPFFHITMFFYLAMIIRLVVMAEVGPVAYASRMDQLSNGNMLERAGAFVMQMDPVSRDIATQLRSAMRDLGIV